MTERDDKVRLVRAPDYRGTVTRVTTDGMCDIEFVGGGTGRFREADLVPDEDKSWPPSGLEAKVPSVDTK